VTIDKESVEQYVKTNVDAQPAIDWNNLWGRVVGPIRAS
jgi:ribose transport system substrate-binding protein